MSWAFADCGMRRPPFLLWASGALAKFGDDAPGMAVLNEVDDLSALHAQDHAVAVGVRLADARGLVADELDNDVVAGVDDAFDLEAERRRHLGDDHAAETFDEGLLAFVDLVPCVAADEVVADVVGHRVE